MTGGFWAAVAFRPLVIRETRLLTPYSTASVMASRLSRTPTVRRAKAPKADGEPSEYDMIRHRFVRNGT